MANESNGDVQRILVTALLVLCSACDDAPSPAPTPAPQDPLHLRVTGDAFAWRLRYPGPDGILHTDDDIHTSGDLHLPARRPIRIDLTSHDYLYVLALPHLALNEIAVPDLIFTLSFETDGPGRHALEGNQLCGFSHAGLRGALIVHTPVSFDAWLSDTENAGP